MQRHWPLASFCFLASALVAPWALADGPPKPAASGYAPVPAGATPAATSDDDEGVAQDEKPEHKEKRRTYIRKMKKQLEDLLHGSGRQLTPEEHATVERHWRLSMRLWRIRHLADEAGDKAAVAKVDALLTKVDAKTVAKLKEIEARSTVNPGAKK